MRLGGTPRPTYSQIGCEVLARSFDLRAVGTIPSRHSIALSINLHFEIFAEAVPNINRAGFWYHLGLAAQESCFGQYHAAISRGDDGNPHCIKRDQSDRRFGRLY